MLQVRACDKSGADVGRCSRAENDAQVLRWMQGFIAEPYSGDPVVFDVLGAKGAPVARYTFAKRTGLVRAKGRELVVPARGESCALYLRVSTEEQTTANQQPELVAMAKARKLKIAETYEENASAAGVRPMFDRMLDDARRGRFGTIFVWALDRLGRSMVINVQTLLELDRIGVQVVSAREPWLDTSGPVRSLLIAIFSWVAEQERARLIERTKAGLDRARTRGVRLGRPRVSLNLELAHRLRGEGESVRQVARTLGVKPSTLHRELARST